MEITVDASEEREPFPSVRWESGELRELADAPEAAGERLG